eukprot:1562710-Pleurochrysis_carterae.AAC.1
MENDRPTLLLRPRLREPRLQVGRCAPRSPRPGPTRKPTIFRARLHVKQEMQTQLPHREPRAVAGFRFDSLCVREGPI